MSERAFRLDFFIAIAALLISCISAIALIYQTHVIGQQYASTIWPYLSVRADYVNNVDSIAITNDGLGPALVRSAQLTVDGKNLASWSSYLEMLTSSLPSGTSARAFLGPIGPDTTIRPGDTKQLFDVRYSSPMFTRAITAHRVALSFCYCSLNGSCWMLHVTPGSGSPADNASVAACPAHESIESYRAALKTFTYPSARPRRK